MDQKTEEQLWDDLKEVDRRIQRIESGDLGNDLVHFESYLRPGLIATECSLNNVRSALHYFKEVKAVIETALTTGSIPSGMWLPQKVPDYIRDLVEDPNAKIIGGYLIRWPTKDDIALYDATPASIKAYTGASVDDVARSIIKEANSYDSVEVSATNDIPDDIHTILQERVTLQPVSNEDLDRFFKALMENAGAF